MTDRNEIERIAAIIELKLGVPRQEAEPAAREIAEELAAAPAPEAAHRNWKNGCSQPCDAPNGEVPCCCGAWHDKPEAGQGEGVEALTNELRALYRHYVNMLESARDQIISHGGECDPLDVMEKRDPVLKRVREVLENQSLASAQQPSAPAAVLTDEEAPSGKHCAWTEAGGESDIWETSCGELHVFSNGGPGDNSHRYCPYCGGEVQAPAAGEGGGDGA